jgi:hypothetical protein
MKGQELPNHRRRKDKKVESNTDSPAHNQTLNQQTQLHDRDHHIFTNTNTECSWNKLPLIGKRLKRKIQQSAAYRRPTSLTEISTG